jgi:hypothetical protein
VNRFFNDINIPDKQLPLSCIAGVYYYQKS